MPLLIADDENSAGAAAGHSTTAAGAALADQDTLQVSSCLSVVERISHKQDSQSQILALAFR